MPEEPSSFSKTSRTADRAGRALPPRKKLNLDRLHAGMAWVVKCLLKRYGLRPTWVARECGVGRQSLRDYLNGLYLHGRHTLARVALLLGRYPDELERLTRRWMRKYRRRERRKHAGDQNWTLRYPWELHVLLESLQLLL